MQPPHTYPGEWNGARALWDSQPTTFPGCQGSLKEKRETTAFRHRLFVATEKNGRPWNAGGIDFFSETRRWDVFWHARFHCVDSCTVSNLLDLEGWGWWDVFCPDFFLPTPFRIELVIELPMFATRVFIQMIGFAGFLPTQNEQNKHPHVSPACVDPWWGDFVAGRIHSWCNGGRIGNTEVSRFSKPNHLVFFLVLPSSGELTYPKNQWQFWRWFSFSQGGLC